MQQPATTAAEEIRTRKWSHRAAKADTSIFHAHAPSTALPMTSPLRDWQGRSSVTCSLVSRYLSGRRGGMQESSGAVSVLITGGAGQIAYSLIPVLCNGEHG